MTRPKKRRSNGRTPGRVTAPTVRLTANGWGCDKCLFYVEDKPDFPCPRCGAPFVERPLDRDDDALWFSVKVSTFRCLGCDGTYLLEPGDRCPHCGRPADEDDPAWKDRNATFGPSLQLLRARWNTWTQQQPKFSSRGERPALADHLAAMSRTSKNVVKFMDDAKAVFRQTDWAADAAAADTSNLSRLIALCDQAMTAVGDLAETPSPLAVFSVHRQEARALKSGVDAVVRMTLLHDVKYHSEALREMEVVQAAFDTAARHAANVSVLFDRIDRVLFAPGFWAIGDEYETGRVAWEGVDARVSTVTAAADVVRDTFKEIPGVADLPDDQAFLLLPAAAIGASFQDPERLVARAVAVRAVLDQADAAGNWVADPALLAERVWEGHRQLIDQVVRLGYAIRSDHPRKHLLQTALDVFAKFVEGPLRRLGGIAAVASKAGRGDVFDQSACDTYKPAETIQALRHAAPALLEGMDSLLRHAEAHYDFEIDDDGVAVHHLPPRGGSSRIVDHFSDEDLFEQLMNLNEALVAVELALLPYVWTFPNPVVQAVLERKARAKESVFEVLRALGGLRGWTDVEFGVSGDVLHVTGTYRGPDDANPVVDLLPMVAAAWPSLPDVATVNVETGVVAASVTREQFLPQDANEGVRLHRTAALLADVRSQTEGGDDERWLATALLLPAAVMPPHLVDGVLEGVYEAADAVEYLRWLTPQLERADLGEPYGSLRESLVATLPTTTRLLSGLAVAFMKKDRHFVRRCENDLRGHLETLVQLRATAQSLLNPVV